MDVTHVHPYCISFLKQEKILAIEMFPAPKVSGLLTVVCNNSHHLKTPWTVQGVRHLAEFSDTSVLCALGCPHFTDGNFEVG